MDWVARIRENFSLPEKFATDATGQRNSSVLLAVGIQAHSGAAEILLTKRTMLVDSHKGEVSLPGGFWEASDGSLMHTALREAHEEIGTLPEHVEIFGALDAVRTHQGVSIFPWVGKLPLPYAFQPNPLEVERILFLPLEKLIEEGLEPVSVRVGDIKVQSEGIEVQGELVWGATARILAMFRDRILEKS